MQETLKSATESARKLFGNDIHIMVARSPAYGDSDCCIIVNGKNHAAAACGFMQVAKGATIKTERATSFRGSNPYTYSVVTFPV
jgi:hypothetical protein